MDRLKKQKAELEGMIETLKLEVRELKEKLEITNNQSRSLEDDVKKVLYYHSCITPP